MPTIVPNGSRNDRHRHPPDLEPLRHRVHVQVGARTRHQVQRVVVLHQNASAEKWGVGALLTRSVGCWFEAARPVGIFRVWSLWGGPVREVLEHSEVGPGGAGPIREICEKSDVGPGSRVQLRECSGMLCAFCKMFRPTNLPAKVHLEVPLFSGRFRVKVPGISEGIIQCFSPSHREKDIQFSPAGGRKTSNVPSYGGERH